MPIYSSGPRQACRVQERRRSFRVCEPCCLLLISTSFLILFALSPPPFIVALQGSQQRCSGCRTSAPHSQHLCPSHQDHHSQTACTAQPVSQTSHSRATRQLRSGLRSAAVYMAARPQQCSLEAAWGNCRVIRTMIRTMKVCENAVQWWLFYHKDTNTLKAYVG